MQKSFKKLVDIIARLRGKNGCPWDQKQTLKSIRENIIEEAYETVEAIDNNDYQHIKEEAGDLLMQSIFIAQISSEKGKFDIKDVLNDISDKLIRRHPHIYNKTKVKDVKQVLENWESIKKKEKGTTKESSILSNIPKLLPPLLKAQKIQSKVERFGFKWPSIDYPIRKLKEEVQEFIDEVNKKKKSSSAMEEELGDILFVLVNIGRHYKVSPNSALNKTIKKFKKRFTFVEKEVKKQNKDLKKMTIEEIEGLWQEAKK